MVAVFDRVIDQLLSEGQQLAADSPRHRRSRSVQVSLTKGRG
jgi:hypothetical protein